MKRHEASEVVSRPEVWKAPYRQAISFYQAALYAQSAELFRQLTNAPGLQGHLSRFYFARACRREAEQQMALGNYHLASTYLNEALRSSPNSPTLLSFLGECCLRQGKYDEAGRQFAALAKISDTPAQVRLKEALSYYLAGRSAEAIATLEELVTIHSNSFDMNFQLGAMLAADGACDRAIRYLTEACRLRPEQAECQWRLALAHAAAGHIPESVHHLQQAHNLDPANNWILSNLTLAVHQARHFGLDAEIEVVPVDQLENKVADPSIDRLAELIVSEPEFVTAFLELPESGLDEQIFSAVLQILMRALEQHPEFADLHYHCSCVYRRLGQTDKAIEEGQQALTINPRFVNALIHLAGLYAETDRHRQAIDRLKSALAQGANYADVHYTLGKLYQQTGCREQACSHYRRALSINSGYTAAKEALAALAA